MTMTREEIDTEVEVRRELRAALAEAAATVGGYNGRVRAAALHHAADRLSAQPATAGLLREWAEEMRTADDNYQGPMADLAEIEAAVGPCGPKEGVVRAAMRCAKERSEAQAQLAALRAAIVAPSATAWERAVRIDAVLADPAQAAEAHDERMRAEGRDEAMADFTEARVFEAERDALAGQLAALRGQLAEIVRHRDAVPALAEDERRTRAARGGSPDEGWGRDDAPPSWQAWREARDRLDAAKRDMTAGVYALSLADPSQAAEAHDRRVRAEALREAAEAAGKHHFAMGGLAGTERWLRARADEIEGAR